MVDVELGVRFFPVPKAQETMRKLKLKKDGLW